MEDYNTRWETDYKDQVANSNMSIFVAGPVNSVSPMFPEIGHREPEFEEVYKNVKEKLYRLFKADPKEHDIAIIGVSGTAAIEDTLSSVCPKDKKTLIISNGAFGERMTEICNVYGIKHFAAKYHWGEYPKLKEIEE